MFRKVVLSIPIVLCLIILGLSLVVKNKELNKSNIITEIEENPYDLNYILGLETDVKSVIENVKKKLNQASVIIKVKATGKLENHFNSTIQEAFVMHVFKGDEHLLNKSIKIINPSMTMLFDDQSLVGSFCNYFKKDHQYLVFLEDLPDYLNPQNDTLVIVDSLLIPYFDYALGENQAIEQFDYPYSLVKDNEFFATAEGLTALLDLKQELLNQYK